MSKNYEEYVFRVFTHFRITTENLLVNYYEEISRSLSWTLLSTMGVKFTPIVDDTVSAFTMGVKFTPIVNHIVDVEMVLSTMGVKFTPIVDKITASKLHFFVFAMCYHTVF